MPMRALIVLLVVLNLGVALWWVTRSDAVPVPVPPPSPGVPTLQLVAMPAAPAATVPPSAAAPASPAAAPADAPKPAASVVAAPALPPVESLPVAAPPPPPPAVAARPVCASLGPFPERAAAEAAVARLEGRLAQSRMREQADEPKGFRVLLPVDGDRDAAKAVAARIVAAGFSDYYVLAQDGRSTIALGQFSSRERAEQHRQRLVAAGFPARIEPSAPAASQWWVDARLGEGQTRAALRGVAARSLDCAGLR